ncbi:MAG: formate/nitrite transporter family protein [Melioribacteraceae bacterium]|nr:formate/nitrite transporter family protein [Melioribacteraceae bacterium]MCF8263186.1 formate/nitrite transporter family protein [Melioribacteraceae bacterium]MCF8430326.1 formate/nitrite transporter family protein [Melioribacteraceae bacterium]
MTETEKQDSTERQVERDEEEKSFHSVILKRTDEYARHPDDVLEFAIREGEEQIKRPFLSLLLSAIAAGLILGFTAMAVAVVSEASTNIDNYYFKRILLALVYPLGFVICVMSGAELFTEHTATAVYPVLDKRSSFLLLFRLWGIVLLGNLIGAIASSGLLVSAEEVIGAKNGYIEIGKHLVGYSFWPLIASSLLAGWLMALGSWLLFATPLGISQVITIYIVTFLIGIGQLHHSIAGSVEMFTAYFISDQFTFPQLLSFISTAALGNLIGGSIFVALLNYSHIRHLRS